jgi:DNA repair exonuclease SbcCD ATPase subunit
MARTRSDAHAFTSLVLDRLITDNLGDQSWADLALAACDGPEALAAALDGQAPPRPGAAPRPDGAAAVEPPGAYLRSITVEGLRGIAAAATLDLPPGPGLTLVVGRNGSGKSSFAEALELLLTGANRRWDTRSAVWREGWRNLHQPNPCRVQAEFHVEGLGSVTVSRQWEPGAALAESTAWFQAKGKERRPYAELGWQDVISTHRPLLPYSELGTLLEKPSAGFDALEDVLGLEDFITALETLQQARKSRQARVDTAADRLKAIVSRLEAVGAASGDARAAACGTALLAKKKDLAAVARVLGEDGGAPADPSVALLRRAQVQAPATSDVEQAAARLLAGVAEVEACSTTDAGRARALAKLLEQALVFQASHGGADCPVCGAPGRLANGWQTETTRQMTLLRQEAEAAEQSHRRLEQAVAVAREWLEVPRASIQALSPLGLAAVPGALAAMERWHGGRSLQDARALAQHLTSEIGAVRQALATLEDEVRAELTRREDLWQPVAAEVRAWLSEAPAAEAAQAQVADLKKAEAWFKEVQADVRAERFRPIAEQAKAIWGQLRQQSNVELADVQLQGAATRRSVVLDVTVDGVAGAALGVMSQGELNALALSLFMPRASLPESPFRFMAIDDPVQSMDPSRVDGLARALHDAAKTRQVIVFTHDERLPEAVRQLLIPATVIEVTRRPGSVVEAREVTSPIARYFGDAMAIVRTEDLPEEVQRRLVPGFCRSGVEASCLDVVRRRRLKAGAMHHEIEALLEGADTLRKRLALALFDDVTKAGDVGRSLANRWSGADAVARALNEGSHGDYDGGLQRLTRDAERLAARLGELQ